MSSIGRNEPCPCGSGKKYKKCCLEQDRALEQMSPDGSAVSLEDAKMLAFWASSPSKLRDFVDMLDWPNPLQQKLAEVLALELYEGYKPSSAEMREALAGTIVLWNSFCVDMNPTFRKAGGYKAALEFFFLMETSGVPNQSELAAKHGVSASTLANCLNKLEDFIEEQGELVLDEQENAGAPQIHPLSKLEHEANITDITRLLEAQNFTNLEDVQAFLSAQLDKPNARKASSPAAGGNQVREILIAADHATSSAKRKKLLEQAYTLDPEYPDTLLMLSEDTATIVESMQLAKTAMELAAKKLGKTFFEENRGYFWGLVETRPFMRAKAAYAHLLSLSGRLNAACEHYEQLLELNPNDNQGIRYDLLMLYLQMERLEEADQALKSYEEDASCFILYDKLVLEYLKNGVTEHLAFLYKLARKENKHVPAYLLEQKRLPATMPPSYTLSSVEEAITYAFTHIQLWDRLVGLKEWMSKAR
ncbi:SEC-C metal-binding domain-containing protein [Paenibacillus sp. P96]|uniref:SEC-C metal-binding domain-containing protein n=1 Tax=Paenibacillus zeirhizosphaerae TaxID=2987519 RepID=A0ABT9FPA6_9BACL|nr:SEC-C metal-binding domain-containing protein [Paenibacillus sp. P96]MDP4096341.1 SEC-C metal-binding domain-containing protein [Paenibacillus sp. P96]